MSGLKYSTFFFFFFVVKTNESMWLPEGESIEWSSYKRQHPSRAKLWSQAKYTFKSQFCIFQVWPWGKSSNLFALISSSVKWAWPDIATCIRCLCGVNETRCTHLLFKLSSTDQNWECDYEDQLHGKYAKVVRMGSANEQTGCWVGRSRLETEYAGKLCPMQIT